MHLAGLGLEGARGPARQSLHHVSVGSATGHGLSQLISIFNVSVYRSERPPRQRSERAPPSGSMELCSGLHYLSHLSIQSGESPWGHQSPLPLLSFLCHPHPCQSHRAINTHILPTQFSTMALRYRKGSGGGELRSRGTWLRHLTSQVS